MKTALGVLNDHLHTRTYLVGDAVTLADIIAFCNLFMGFQYVRCASPVVYVSISPFQDTVIFERQQICKGAGELRQVRGCYPQCFTVAATLQPIGSFWEHMTQERRLGCLFSCTLYGGRCGGASSQGHVGAPSRPLKLQLRTGYPSIIPAIPRRCSARRCRRPSPTSRGTS